jgi:arylsulfatase A-like enzyme
MKTKVLTYFGIILIGGTLTGCRQGSNEKTPDTESPNIIFIMADDLAAQAITVYGSIYEEYAPTPNLDRLAKEGILLKNVFCTNAICGPSRACILTGKYNHINGYYKNESGGKFNPDQWTFPEELQKHGYQTGLFGKWHLGSEPKGFDYYKFHQGGGQQGFYWDPVYNENGKTVEEKGYATNLTTDYALEWMAQASAKNKPFCLLLQYKAPHRNWDPDSVYMDLWEDIELPYPQTFNDDYSTREKTAGDTDMTMDDLNRRDMKLTPPEGLEGAELNQWYGYGNKRGEIVYPDKSLTPEENRKWKYQTYIKDYLACIKSVDDNIGRVLAYLDQQGLSENTLVIFTSDQGFYLGEHGWFDKRFIYEESLRMPFLVRYPDAIQAGTTNNDIITNIDFAPMILEAAGIEPPEEIQGRSFYGNLLGQTPDDWQKSMYYHYYEFPYWHHVQPHYGIRKQKYKLAHFYYNIDEWEFYNLDKDPNELVNEMNNPEYSETIKEMKEELNQLMIKYQDNKTLDEFRAITDRDFGQIE